MSEDSDAHGLFRTIANIFIGHENVGLGTMLKAEALQVGGKSFAYPTEGAIIFKLPKPEVDALEADGKGRRLVIGKRTMKEWVVVPTSQRDLCWQLAERACEFVGDL